MTQQYTSNAETNNRIIRGNANDNQLIGTAANELLFGDIGSDTITGGAGVDFFAYGGDDPFEGQNVSAPGRQIIAGEDFITDFNFAEDRYLFSAIDFDIIGNVNFAAVNANAPNATIAPGTNVVTLLNIDNDHNPNTPFVAGTAANQIAELTTEDGAGFFVYYNTQLGVNRLVYSSNLNDADADLKVISRQTDLVGQNAVNALSNFSADNFVFENILIAGDAGNNELVGTAAASEVLFGDLGSDTLTGGAGMDIFAYGNSDPFEGQDVSAPGRQIIAEEDLITDFNFAEDIYFLNSDDFGIANDVNFTGIDANAPDALIAPGTNVVTLLNSDNDHNPNTPFIAGTAANQIAELTTEDGAGFFVYHNTQLEVNRLVYSSNLNDADADLKIISQQNDLVGHDAVDALGDFSADNFVF